MSQSPIPRPKGEPVAEGCLCASGREVPHRLCPVHGQSAHRHSYFEHYVGSATVALILQTKASDLPAALDIVKRVRDLGYYMREAGSRGASG